MHHSKEIRVLTKRDFPMANQNFHIEKSDIYPDFIGVPHKHKFIEIVYVISGTAFHEVHGESTSVKKGDLFLINMDTPHVFRYDEQSAEPFSTYDLKFTPEFFDTSVKNYQALESLNNSFLFYTLFHSAEETRPFLSVSEKSSFELIGIFEKIYQEFTEKKKGYIEIIRGYLIELIVKMFRMLDQKGNEYNIEQSVQAVDFICNYINNNYSSKISIQELANQVYMNLSYLGRVFRKTTGMSISAMIQKVRVEHACRMLSETKRTISDISRSCGFEDIKFFYKVFKKYTGILPGEYREMRKQAPPG
jgi:YesN/AraC family two-component response regulator